MLVYWIEKQNRRKNNEQSIIWTKSQNGSDQTYKGIRVCLHPAWSCIFNFSNISVNRYESTADEVFREFKKPKDKVTSRKLVSVLRKLIAKDKTNQKLFDDLSRLAIRWVLTKLKRYVFYLTTIFELDANHLMHWSRSFAPIARQYQRRLYQWQRQKSVNTNRCT